ncbi:DUF885 family protein [soil metagenome]
MKLNHARLQPHPTLALLAASALALAAAAAFAHPAPAPTSPPEPETAAPQPKRTLDSNAAVSSDTQRMTRQMRDTMGECAPLDAAMDAYRALLLDADPTGATIRGQPGFSGRLADVSAPARAARLARTKSILDSLAPLEKSVPDSRREDLLVLERTTRLALAGAPFHREQLSVDDRGGPQTDLLQLPDSLPLRTPAELAAYAQLLEGVPRYIDDTIANLRAGLAAKRVQPKCAVVSIVAQARAQITPEIIANPASSVFARPFGILAPTDPTAVRGVAAVKSAVLPAFARLADFLANEYVPACRDTVGASAGVDGLAAYEHALRAHTTTSMSAQEIHDLGLREVARIKAEMRSVIARTDFPQRATLQDDALFEAFVHDLRTDPRFYFATPAELMAGYRDIAKRIDPALSALFGTLPRNPYGVREIPRVVALASPTAYYYEGSIKAGVPGYFMANTTALPQRPRYEMVALTLHEAMPGHHLQIALAQELERIHPLRTMLDFTAFVEGWGLYSESLGLEMPASTVTLIPALTPDSRQRDESRGLFADPYDDFGRLNYEMWRALRLVVDTGIHAFGWSRQRAIDFMLANSALSPLNIEREVDRYIAWPGQACAYKIGELTIKRLRKESAAALGDRFSIRAFHDHLLGAGAIPLDALEARMKAWTAAQMQSK